MGVSFRLHETVKNGRRGVTAQCTIPPPKPGSTGIGGGQVNSLLSNAEDHCAQQLGDAVANVFRCGWRRRRLGKSQSGRGHPHKHDDGFDDELRRDGRCQGRARQEQALAGLPHIAELCNRYPRVVSFSLRQATVNCPAASIRTVQIPSAAAS